MSIATKANSKECAHYEIIGDGQGIHWPDIYEDIGTEGMLHGTPASRKN